MVDVVNTARGNTVVVDRDNNVATVTKSTVEIRVAAPGPAGPPGDDADVAAHEAADNPHPQYLLIADVGPSLPPGGATGQALRKLSGTDGDADWSTHWLVDPVTGALTESRTYSGLYSGQVPQTFLNATYDTAYTDPGAGTWLTQLKVRFPEGFSFAVGRESTGGSSQIGYVNTQFGQDVHQDGAYQFQAATRSTQNYGFSSSQFGDSNTQTGGSHAQFGSGNTQSGYGHFQSGYDNTQSGYYSAQFGRSNTQSGDYGAQLGRALNDGGFDYTAMFGFTKTATVTRRAYFALDNGIWLKPFAGDAASPENGVIGYNSTLGQFRFYQGGGWESYLTENNPAFSGTMQYLQPIPYADYNAMVAAGPLIDLRVRNLGWGGLTYESAVKVAPQGSLSIRAYTLGADTSTQTGTTSLQIASDGQQSATRSIQVGDDVVQTAGGSIQVGNQQNQTGYSNAQFGRYDTQSGYYNFQAGYSNTQSGSYNAQFGGSHTQSGNYGFQTGYGHTQSGRYGFQAGYNNTQTANRGLQSGFTLNDGGFDYAFMVGASKTAGVTQRAYFAMDNGIWLKPFAGDAASPEDGVLAYNSTLGKFRAYEGGAWKDFVTDWRVVDGKTEVTNFVNPGVLPVATPLDSIKPLKLQASAVRTSSMGGTVNWISQFEWTQSGNLRISYFHGSYPAANTTQTGSSNLQIASNGSTQSGYYNIQTGNGTTQAGAYGCIQAGNSSTQSGSYSLQVGYATQTASYSLQVGYGSTQAGNYGLQVGKSLNDGNFDNVFMAGLGPKTATVEKRAYFALDNGIWLKPFAGDAASPENGVIGYNSTLGKFRFYQGGGWESYLTENNPAFSGTMQYLQPIPYADYNAMVAAGPLIDLRVRNLGGGGLTYESAVKVAPQGSLSIRAYTLGADTSTQTGTTSLQIASDGQQSATRSIQVGDEVVQTAGGSIQVGNQHSQLGYSNAQFGRFGTQSGYYNFHSGNNNTQSGYYNFQVGANNVTTAGDCNFQAGAALNNGGKHFTAMFGQTKTATIDRRAYFALDNGIWLKPFAGDAASPENGVIGYNSTLGKFRFYQNAGWKSLDVLPTGGTAGQALRKVDGTDGNAAWSSHWVVDPTTGAQTADIAYANTGSAYQSFGYLAAGVAYTYAGADFISEYRQTAGTNISNTFRVIAGGYYGPSTQSGYANLQIGFSSTQTGSQNFQYGSANAQSGVKNFQFGRSHTQSGTYGFQTGWDCTQAGSYGSQSGYTLNDGGYSHVHMFGQSKTATADHRAYFALDNGIWLKPFAGDAASPENGVLAYNSTLGKFRAYEAGAWKDLIPVGGGGAAFDERDAWLLG